MPLVQCTSDTDLQWFSQSSMQIPMDGEDARKALMNEVKIITQVVMLACIDYRLVLHSAVA